MNIYINLKEPKNIFNILEGTPCGENLNYIIHKM